MALLRFPEVPLFGRAARESRIESPMPSGKCFPNASPRSPLMYRNPASASGVQPLYRQSSGGGVESDPEAEIRQLNSRRVELERR